MTKRLNLEKLKKGQKLYSCYAEFCEYKNRPVVEITTGYVSSVMMRNRVKSMPRFGKELHVYVQTSDRAHSGLPARRITSYSSQWSTTKQESCRISLREQERFITSLKSGDYGQDEELLSEENLVTKAILRRYRSEKTKARKKKS